jgi:sterol desaturase/sphingolipid hydroxylase (fatty acid hydroxylase superfamily)
MPIADWILRHGETLQVALFFALLPALAALEWAAPRRSGPMERAARWPANLILTALNFAAFGVLPVSLLAAAVWAQGRGWGLLNAVAAPAWMAVAVTLLVRAFISFGTHWLMHHVPLLWRVHRVHHLDTELDVTTTVRFHPLEFVVQALPGLPLVVAFGLAPWVLALYEVLDVVLTLWTHSNVRLPQAADRVLRRLIVTPDLHRIHHSAWEPETNSNFGAVFPLWDLLLGTYRAAPRDGHQQMRLGLEEVRGRDAQRPLWLLGSVARERLEPRPGRMT